MLLITGFAEFQWTDGTRLDAIVRLEGVGKLKNPMIPSGTKPAVFRLLSNYTFFIS
jgi:hypothetical protein